MTLGEAKVSPDFRLVGEDMMSKELYVADA